MHDEISTPLSEEKKAIKQNAHQKQIEEISKIKDYSKAHNLDEVHNLKDISQMTNQEILKELQCYGISLDEGTNKIKLRIELQQAREERALHDKNSDEVDGHIGTYVQGESMYCTVLAQLDTMSDEDISKMFSARTDENGKKIYTVTFPIDSGTTNNSVEITEDELTSGEITINENGKSRILNDFPKGDSDVTMLTMAFVKRFGSDISDNGAWVFQTKNKFRTPDSAQYMDNQYIEDILDNKTLTEQKAIGVLSPEEIARKGYEVKPLSGEDLSWITDKEYNMAAKISIGLITELSDGRKACVCKQGIFLSDGTKIENHHAMSIRGIDEKSQELIISGSEFNNMSEVRVPLELMKFFETGTTKQTPGVSKTPIPDVT